MNVVSETLETLAIGQPTHFKNLSLFPLQGGGPGPRAYLTLREAIETGQAEVTEISEGGSVPELRFENHAAKPVLILDGEELVGAKQNRIANVTILAPAETTIILPVSCVEMGRWADHGRNLAPSNRTYHAEGRRRKTATVTESMRDCGERDADQNEVWQEIAMKSLELEVDSPTRAMADIFEQHETRISDYVAAFSAAPDQVGAVFAIGDRIEGLEFFDNAETFAEMLPKLVRSYALDALGRANVADRKARAFMAQAFVLTLARARMEHYPAVGLGTEVRLTATGVVAAGLVESERVVHLVGFSAPAKTRRHDEDLDIDLDEPGYGNQAA